MMEYSQISGRAGRLLVGLVRSARVAIVAGASLAMAGCVSEVVEVKINPDQTVSLEVQARFDKEMKTVFGAIESHARHASEPQFAMLANGICNAVNAVPLPDPNITLSGEQYEDGDSFVCRFKANLPSIAGLEFPPKNPPAAAAGDPMFAMASSMFSFKPVGDRRMQLRLDLTQVPDLRIFAMAGFQQEMAKGGTKLTPQQAQEVLNAYLKAYKAALQLLMRGRTIEYKITAAKILDTNGELSADGKTATFKFDAAEFASFIVDMESGARRKLFVEYEY